LKVSTNKSVEEYKEAMKEVEDSILQKSPVKGDGSELESYFQRESEKLVSKND